MATWELSGWAHLCFMKVDNNGIFEQFQGHVIDNATRSTFGIIGQHVLHEDPNHNDCMDPDIFYRVVLKDYSDNGCAMLLARRSAGIVTDPSDNDQHNHGQTCVFETTQFLTGAKAQMHCLTYLPELPQEGSEDWVVCLGTIRLALEKKVADEL
ncbi:hypothetical protein DFQ29_002645 [Apophysomyces sp. BC1021]|nr:hypothetical protein DFQ29_002645 [Apophysomyces sp. BC1021]